MQFLENVGKHRNVKVKITERRRSYLISESNYHTKKFFTETLLAIEIRKTQILINKPVNLGLSILHLNKTVMYDFWYDYVKPKYSENVKLCSIDTYSWFDTYSYKNVAEDLETKFDTSNFKLDRLLPKRKSKKVIGLMKNESGAQILKELLD